MLRIFIRSCYFHLSREKVVILNKLLALFFHPHCKPCMFYFHFQYTSDPFVFLTMSINCISYCAMMEQVQNSSVPLNSGTMFQDSADPLANALLHPQSPGTLVLELDWLSTRTRKDEPLVLCIAGADSSFRLVEVNTYVILRMHNLFLFHCIVRIFYLFMRFRFVTVLKFRQSL